MTKLTATDVRHIAKLCRLHLSEKDVGKFSGELTKILGFVEKLQEVNTQNAEPTPQATGLRNVLREDRLTSEEAEETPEALLRSASRPAPDELLACSPLPIIDHQIQTPSAHG